MQDVVVEVVFLIPQPNAFATDVVHRARYPKEVLEKFRRDVLVDRILPRQLERDAHHIQGEHSHPARPIALLEPAAIRKWCTAIEDADVIEAEKTAFENVAAAAVLAIHPPGEVDE